MAHLQDKDYALVIGINDYPRHGAQGKNLTGAVPDANRFAQWLTDRVTGGGLPDRNCHLITSCAQPLAPVATDIDDAFEAIWDAAEAQGGGRRFYLFFAGHGQSVTSADVDDVDVALCLPQWSRRRLSATLSSDNYWKTVKRCMPFQEVVAFLDCCRSRTLRTPTNGTTVVCPVAATGSELVKGVIVYAAEDESRAFEAVARDADGEDDDDAARGHFTSALLSALEGGAADPAGGVSWAALWDSLQADVPRIAFDAGKRQNPRIKDFGLAQDAVFGAAQPVGADAGPNFTIKFGPDRVGPVMLLNADAQPLRTDMPETGPWKVRLDYELHTLVDSGTGDATPIRFGPGQEGGHVTF